MKSAFYPRCHVALSCVLDGRTLTAPNSRPLLIETIPTSASVVRNGYNEADTFSLEFDARRLPFDPHLVASIAVGIYMYDAGSLDDRREWQVPEYEMIRGLVDEPELSITESGQVVKMSGRDYTGLLLDAEWDPRKRIPAGQPIDETIQAIADAAAPPGAMLRFEVVYQSDQIPIPPIVGKASRSTKKKGLWVKPGKSVWDVIYEMALHAGLIAFVRGEQIIVTDPKTQTVGSAARAPRLVYGRNLKSLSATRRLAKERVPQVKIATWDPQARKTVEVVYPKGKQKTTTAVGLKKDDVIVIPAPRGVRDRDTLENVARSWFESMARAEASYTATTKHLEAIEGDGAAEQLAASVDLLRLHAGHPVRIEFDPFNQEQMRALSVEQRAEHMLALGYSHELAAFIAAEFERLDQFRQPFYTRQVEFDFSDDDGISISVEAANYAHEAREQHAEVMEAMS